MSIIELDSTEHPTYSLDTVEMRTVREFSERLIRAKDPNSHKPRSDTMTRLECNIDGYMAEAAVCHHYGVPFEYAIYNGRGDTHDMVLGGHKLGIKGTRNPRGNLLITVEETEKENPPEWYVLCHVQPTTGKVELWGKYPLAKARTATPRSVKDGGPLNYVVSRRLLYPVKGRVKAC